MPYQQKRPTNQGANIVMSLLGALIGGAGGAATANTAVEATNEAGQIPFQYKGDPNALVGTDPTGQFIDTKGQLTKNPFSDTRNWGARVTGQPDIAGQENTRILGEKTAQDLLSPGKIEEAGGMENVRNEGALKEYKGKKEIDKSYAPQEQKDLAAKAIAMKYGLAGKDAADLIPHIKDSSIATLAKVAAQSTTAADVSNATRSNDVSAAKANSGTAVSQAQRTESFNTDPTNAQLFTGGQEAAALSPIADLVKKADVSLQPGESFTRNANQFGPNIGSLMGSGTGQGASKQLLMKKLNLNGKEYSYPQETIVPGQFKTSLKLDLDDINKILGTNGPKQPSDDFGPMTLGTARHKTGLPLNTTLQPAPGGTEQPALPPTKEQFMTDEFVKKLMQLLRGQQPF